MPIEFSFNDAIAMLSSQGKFYINLGLDRISKILNLLGNPQDNLKIIHVAGTNGKGSVCNILSAVLSENYKVGLYTSPHIFDYTERIKINGAKISEEIFAEKVKKIVDIADKNNIHLTEFEILTALAFEYFAEENVDYLVLETGLGGRFDATNVIKQNLASIITDINFDHTERLGNTIDKIAFEKAGIIKIDCPLVISNNNLGFEVIKKVAQEKNVKICSSKNSIKIIWKNNQNFAKINEKNYEFNLLGEFQAENLELVYNVLKTLDLFDEKAFENGLKKVEHFGRMTYLKDKNLIIDGSHNPDGANVLRQSLDFYFPNIQKKFIFGCLKNKDYENMMKNLFRAEDEIYFYHFDNINSAEVNELKAKYDLKAKEFRDFVYDKSKLTVISGSFYMLSELLLKCEKNHTFE